MSEIDNITKTYLSVLLEAGCKPQFVTNLFGKPYVMLTDPQGVHFLERLPDDFEEEAKAMA